MHLQVLVHPQGVQCLGIEARQEHAHHYQYVQFLVLHAQGNVLVVVGKALRIHPVGGAKHPVVVVYGTRQKLLAHLVQTVGAFGVLVLHSPYALVLCLVGGIGEDGGHTQAFALGPFCLLTHELVVVQACLLRTVHGKDGVEALGVYLCAFLFHPLLPGLGHLLHVLRHAHAVALVALCLACKVVQNVRHIVADVSRVFQQFVRIYAPHLFIIHTLAPAHGANVVNLELQHVLVVDGIDYGVAVQGLCAVALLVGFSAKELCRGGQLLVLGGAAGILGKDGRAREAEDIVFLEFLGNELVHFAELRTVALVEYQHHILLQAIYVLASLQQVAQFLYGGDDYAATWVVQLALEYGRIGIAVGGILLEVVILLHRLVVQILAVDHKEHLLHLGQP